MAKGYKMVKPLGSLTKKRLKPTSAIDRAMKKTANKSGTLRSRQVKATIDTTKKKVKGSISRNPGKTALALGAVGAAGTAGIIHKNKQDNSVKGRIKKALKR